MAYRSLRDFIARLESRGRTCAGEGAGLDRPGDDRDPDPADRRRRSGGAVREAVKADGTPSDMPVLVNLFGTVKRVAMGVTMGGRERTSAMDLREVGELLAQLRQPEPPRSLREAAALLPLVKTVLAMKPKTGRKPPCQEIVWRGDDIDLGRLPDPDLLAGRARAADHLAAGGDQGPRRARARTITISASIACR